MSLNKRNVIRHLAINGWLMDEIGRALLTIEMSGITVFIDRHLSLRALDRFRGDCFSDAKVYRMLIPHGLRHRRWEATAQTVLYPWATQRRRLRIVGLCLRRDVGQGPLHHATAVPSPLRCRV